MSESYTFKIPENVININSSSKKDEARKDGADEPVSYTKKGKPTICFATMCKNEEHCIRETLESVYKYIDYWVVEDTGSTDRTCEIVTEFFKEKNIPGELYVDEWQGFDKNKTKRFDYCYKKADYILHLDADDLLVGDFSFTEQDAGKLQYYCWAKRGEFSTYKYKILLLFYNHVHWRFCGVAHTIIKCLDKYTLGENGDISHKNFTMISRDSGARGNDSDKYKKDALILMKQFFNTLIEDPDSLNNRSIFYTAQSYYDCDDYENSAKWYSLYTKIENTWIEEKFECYVRLGNLFQKLGKSFEKVEEKYLKAISIIPDRAEPYMNLGRFYHQQKEWEKGYAILKKGMKIDYNFAKTKYILFLNEHSYGKYIADELSVSCYWTNRFEEGKELIEKIIYDPDMIIYKERISENLQYMHEGLKKASTTNQVDESILDESIVDEYSRYLNEAKKNKNATFKIL